MAVSSTSGAPDAFGRGPEHARQPAACRQMRRLKAVLIRVKRVAAILIMAEEVVMTARAMVVAAAEAIPHLEQREADELRKEVKACVKELFVGLNEAGMNELFVGVNVVLAQTSILIAMLEMPRRYLCENLAKLAKIQDSKRRMFDEHASKALRTWFCSVILDIGSSSTAPILGGMKRNLTDVCEKLRGLSGLKLSLECGTTEFSLAGVVDDLKKILGACLFSRYAG